MVSSPCKGCSDRAVGCHGKCAQYIDYKKADAEQKEHIRKQVFVDYTCDKVRKDSVTRAYRRYK